MDLIQNIKDEKLSIGTNQMMNRRIQHNNPYNTPPR